MPSLGTAVLFIAGIFQRLGLYCQVWYGSRVWWGDRPYIFVVFDFLSIERFNGPMSGANDSRPSCIVLSIGSMSCMNGR